MSDDRLPGLVSLAFDDIPTPDFADVGIKPLPDGSPLDPATWAREVFSVASAPIWVRLLLGLRQLVSPMIGVRRASAGVFHVDRVVGEEALIAADDRHLDFRVGVAVDPRGRMLRVTTAVRLHGWRGRVYFAPVRLLHGPVVQAMMARAISRMSPRR